MRVDRFFEVRFPGLSFSHIQRIIRKGEVRVNGKRTQPKVRLEAGQAVRIPPLKVEAPAPRDDAPAAQKDRAFLKSIILFEDADVMVLNKPMGLAVQGGSGTTRHIDGMLGTLRGPDGQRPRLVHRLDKDTAGCLLVAKTRFAAAALAKTFRSRSARKIYWALVAGVPKPAQGRISTYLAKQEVEETPICASRKHGEKDAVHAVTYYAVVETAAHKFAWISLKPVTGRTHQLRRIWPMSATRLSAIQNISTLKTGNFPVVCKTSCTCWRGGSRYRIRVVVSSTSRRRCRLIWSNPGICSGLTRNVMIRSRKLRRSSGRGEGFLSERSHARISFV